MKRDGWSSANRHAGEPAAAQRSWSRRLLIFAIATLNS
jgi:hypothetical protein